MTKDKPSTQGLQDDGSRQRVRVSELLYPTPAGSAHLAIDVPFAPVALLVLGHGAGGDIDAPDLLTVREAALSVGAAVVRVRQPYRQAGRRAPAPAGQLDLAFAAVLAGIAGGSVTGAEGLAAHPLVLGGRSSGARVAARVAAAAGPQTVAGLLALAYPLSPPGRPLVSRLDELLAGAAPTLVVQGGRDPYGSADDVRTAVGASPQVVVAEVAYADHSFRTRKVDPTTTAHALAFAAAAVRSWLLEKVLATRESSGR